MKHSGEKGRLGRLSDHAGRNASERRAGLETLNAEADPTVMRGRPPAGREESDERTGRFPPGYWRRHAWKMEGRSNTGTPVGAVHAATGTPRGAGRADRVAEEARSTEDAG